MITLMMILQSQELRMTLRRETQTSSVEIVSTRVCVSFFCHVFVELGKVNERARTGKNA